MNNTAANPVRIEREMTEEEEEIQTVTERGDRAAIVELWTTDVDGGINQLGRTDFSVCVSF